MNDIKKITINQFFEHDDSSALMTEYADECRTCGMPEIDPDIDMYNAMENAGLLSIYGAFDGERLCGFMVLLVTRVPHYSKFIGTIESIFVAKDDRAGGHGMALLNHAKQLIKESEAVGLFVSAPAVGVFDKVLQGLDGKHTNNIYFWEMPNE